MNFASDNTAPAAPEVLQAVIAANSGFAAAYGSEPLADAVRDRIREVFEAPDATVGLVATGTAANSIALALHCPPWGAVLAHPGAHIANDECGAPEFFSGGAKIVPVGGSDAKMSADALDRQIATMARAGIHGFQPAVLSLANVTEAGTVYTLPEITHLTKAARAHGLACQLDGARFANALVALGCTPAEMTWKAGIDVVSFGGTKNGCLGVEAVVIFELGKAREFELRRKRAGHLFSKHRFLSAQLGAYLADDLWLHLAARANRAAARLSAGIATLDGVEVLHPTEANMVFAGLPRALHDRAVVAGAEFHSRPDNGPGGHAANDRLACRLVCSWCTDDTEIDRFLALLRRASATVA